MSLVHLTVTRVAGYDHMTLFFDDREEADMNEENPFSLFEKEFIPEGGAFNPHPEYSFSISYYGYFMFPGIAADEIHNLYKVKCEAKPFLEKRYNIYFTNEYVHLEEMIKRFDRPLKTYVKFEHKYKTYCHRLEYIARSIQILRDIQTAVYETGEYIAAKELELNKKVKGKMK
ncbi:MAG: hypothetical protein JW874_04030 [Spirochaetales bacterium]|nr:hypothetical protein [Spirochaetales bacterium]